MFDLDDCIGIITSRSTKEITDAFSSKVEACGITRVQWIAIYYIGKEEGITQKQLGEKMDLKESTVARLIDRMEKDGTVERVKDASDKRISKLYLTKLGQYKREETLPIGESFSKEGIEGISEEHLNIFKDVLNKIVANTKKNLK